MNKTYRAVMGAFPSGRFPTLRDIYFTSEPEASALWVVQDLVAKENWKLHKVLHALRLLDVMLTCAREIASCSATQVEVQL